MSPSANDRAACEHAWAKYPINPHTGERVDGAGMAFLGAFGYGLGSFCMRCGCPQGDSFKAS